MDTMTARERSALMARIGGRNTKPELALRRILFLQGYRYRLHASGLPGTPDIVFPGRRAVIFVHGCFWHRHPNCTRCTLPKTRPAYWQAKFDRNVARDQTNVDALVKGGWRVLVVWECEIKKIETTMSKVYQFLGPPRIAARYDHATPVEKRCGQSAGKSERR